MIFFLPLKPKSIYIIPKKENQSCHGLLVHILLPASPSPPPTLRFVIMTLTIVPFFSPNN